MTVGQPHWFQRLAVLAAACLLTAGLSTQSQNLPDAPQPQAGAGQNLPDAPSTSQPPKQAPQPTVPPQTQPPRSNAPSAKVTDAPPGSAPQDANGRDELFRFIVNVRSVVVPVTVKDTSGHLVDGLLARDFTVYEDGKAQQIRFFTSDPFPLSAAVVVDLGMPDAAVQKVNDTLTALGAAFGQFDEVAIFTYDHNVKQQQDFSPAVSDRLMATFRKMKGMVGRQGGVPVTGGPMVSGPTVNGRPADPGVFGTQSNQGVTLVREESRVLNDAVMQAANELSRREQSRRKVLFVISDGREYGSKNSYSDVLKVLLTNNISVYGIGTDSAAIPIYSKLEKIHLPRRGYGDILPRYASATGGQVFAEFDKTAIEQAYSRVTEEARNQYTIGYTAPQNPSSNYRSIEVIVHRPEVKVFAKDGYYPLPPRKANTPSQ